MTFIKLKIITLIVVEVKERLPEFTQKPRNMNLKKMKFLNDKIKDLIKVKMIRPAFNPTFESSIFLAPKKEAKN